ncbi:MAG: DUF342 domain-containing protein [Candidatus Aminicenantes bacterium]|nr:MAG: DUF342 domain-containing protein [Candidatus Aminicenantes bacterium]
MVEESNIKISISKDEYSAHMTVTPDPNLKLSLTDLGPLLKQQGVVFGIKKDALMSIIDRYKKRTYIDNILVAEGIRPCQGVKPAVEYKFKLSSQPKTDASGRIDYREISKILNIKKGQLLAVKRKLKPPVNGETVTGKRTTFPEIEDIPLKIGENVEKDEQEDFIYYRAARDGALKFERNTLWVLPTLEIKEDVDFSVGNVCFKGDVKVARDVLPDFIVEAEGKISIRGAAIACKLSSKDTIEVKAGIVGKNKGEVDSGEDITAAFVENARLNAEYDVMIKNGIIGSKVRCGGSLKMEMPRSRIVGSTIQAARGIVAYNVGSRLDTSTRLIAGIFPGKEEEYLKIKKHLVSRLNEAREIEKKYGRSILENKNFSPTASQQMKEDTAKWDLLKREIQRVHQRLKQTEEAMYDYGAVILVKETLYPRVYLEIGKYKLTTGEEFYNVTIKYSPEEDRLVIV